MDKQGKVRQSPLHKAVPVGGSVNITCSTSGPLKGVFLGLSWPKNMDVIYYEEGENSTVDQQFQGRISFSGPQHNLTITMSLLQLADSGLYTCRAIVNHTVLGPGTLVMVTEKPCQETQEAHRHQEPGLMFLILPSALAVGFFLLGLSLGLLYALRSQVKKLCASGEKSQPCVVYEDMSYCGRNASPYQ
ncbi:T-cell antigen CD7 isoform X2 [Fukomys damarensis]|uniref:T-cell antigen CD7 isoform X2 n=1 Tax=Fukomys damarensis TaxID=885580 RepID=UPI00053FB949|nr:T-cell antigen CD7 isoform X2 [Fukomys damarensis]